MDRQKFSQLLVRLRKEKNLTQQDFAELFNVSFQAVSKWEKGDSIPDITTLEKISQFYGISINYLINGESEEKQPPTRELVKRRMFKLIWCSIFLLVHIAVLFFPAMISSNNTNYFFEFFILPMYREYGLIFVVSWLSQLAAIIIGIVSVFIYKNKNLVSIEKSLSLFGVLNILSFLALIGSFNYIPGFTNLIPIAVAIYILYWLMLVFNSRLNFKNKLDNPMQKYYDRGAFILSNILFNITILTAWSFNGLEQIFSTLSILFSIASLIIYIIMFKYNAKVYNILFYVFMNISFGLLTILFLIVFFYEVGIFGIASVLFINIIYVIFEVKLNKLNKKAQNTINLIIK